MRGCRESCNSRSIDHVQVYFQRLRNSRSRIGDVASAIRNSVVARFLEFNGFFHNPWFAASCDLFDPGGRSITSTTNLRPLLQLSKSTDYAPLPVLSGTGARGQNYQRQDRRQVVEPRKRHVSPKGKRRTRRNHLSYNELNIFLPAVKKAFLHRPQHYNAGMTAKAPPKVQAINAPRFGVHVSVAGGLENGIAEGGRLGCECIQIFVKNQRQWHSTPLTEAQTQAFRAARSATSLTPVIAHANYLLNLASPAETTRSMSIDVLTDELSRCEALGVEGLVLHPGSHLQNDELKNAEKSKRRNAETDNQSRERKRPDVVFPSRDREGAGLVNAENQGIERIAASLDEIHQRCPGFRSMILLETTAGQGTNIGWRFEHLRGILDRVGAPGRLGICLDTCHLFAAGYDFRTPETYAVTIEQLDRVIGVAQVKCIHTNDSKKDLGSRVDRHDHIGKGKIGKSGFAHFINDPRFFGVPMILETPKGVDGRGTELDKVNLKRLRALVTKR